MRKKAAFIRQFKDFPCWLMLEELGSSVFMSYLFSLIPDQVKQEIESAPKKQYYCQTAEQEIYKVKFTRQYISIKLLDKPEHKEKIEQLYEEALQFKKKEKNLRSGVVNLSAVYTSLISNSVYYYEWVLDYLGKIAPSFKEKHYDDLTGIKEDDGRFRLMPSGCEYRIGGDSENQEVPPTEKIKVLFCSLLHDLLNHFAGGIFSSQEISVSDYLEKKEELCQFRGAIPKNFLYISNASLAWVGQQYPQAIFESKNAYYVEKKYFMTLFSSESLPKFHDVMRALFYDIQTLEYFLPHFRKQFPYLLSLLVQLESPINKKQPSKYNYIRQGIFQYMLDCYLKTDSDPKENSQGKECFVLHKGENSSCLMGLLRYQVMLQDDFFKPANKTNLSSKSAGKTNQSSCRCSFFSCCFPSKKNRIEHTDQQEEDNGGNDNKHLLLLSRLAFRDVDKLSMCFLNIPQHILRYAASLDAPSPAYCVEYSLRKRYLGRLFLSAVIGGAVPLAPPTPETPVEEEILYLKTMPSKRILEEEVLTSNINNMLQQRDLPAITVEHLKRMCHVFEERKGTAVPMAGKVIQARLWRIIEIIRGHLKPMLITETWKVIGDSCGIKEDHPSWKKICVEIDAILPTVLPPPATVTTAPPAQSSIPSASASSQAVSPLQHPRLWSLQNGGFEMEKGNTGKKYTPAQSVSNTSHTKLSIRK